MSQDIIVHRGTLTVPANSSSASVTVTLTKNASTAVADGHVFVRRSSGGCAALTYLASNNSAGQSVVDNQQFTSTRLSYSALSGNDIQVTLTPKLVSSAYDRVVQFELWEYTGQAGGVHEFVASPQVEINLGTGPSGIIQIYSNVDTDAALSDVALNSMPMYHGEQLTTATAATSGFMGPFMNYRFATAPFGTSVFCVAARGNGVTAWPFKIWTQMVHFKGDAWVVQPFEVNCSTGGGNSAVGFAGGPMDYSRAIPLTQGISSNTFFSRDFGDLTYPEGTASRTYTPKGHGSEVTAPWPALKVSRNPGASVNNTVISGYYLHSANLDVAPTQSANISQGNAEYDEVFGTFSTLSGGTPTITRDVNEDLGYDIATRYATKVDVSDYTIGSFQIRGTGTDFAYLNGGDTISVDLDENPAGSNDTLRIRQPYPNDSMELRVLIGTFRSTSTLPQPNLHDVEMGEAVVENVPLASAGSEFAFYERNQTLLRSWTTVFVPTGLSGLHMIYDRDPDSQAIRARPLDNPTGTELELIYEPRDGGFAPSDYVTFVMQRLDNRPALSRMLMYWDADGVGHPGFYGSAEVAGDFVDLDTLGPYELSDFDSADMQAYTFDLRGVSQWTSKTNISKVRLFGDIGSGAGPSLAFNQWFFHNERDSFDLDVTSSPDKITLRQIGAAMLADLDLDAAVDVVFTGDFPADVIGRQVLEESALATLDIEASVIGRMALSQSAIARLEIEEDTVATVILSDEVVAKTT